MNFFRQFFSRTPIFLEVEARVLKDVERALPPQARATFSEQVAKITKIQRLDKGREVDFYYREDDCAPLFEALSDADEYKIASLRLRATDSGHQAEANVWLVKGRLFSIEFNAPPGDLGGETLLSEVALYF